MNLIAVASFSICKLPDQMGNGYGSSLDRPLDRVHTRILPHAWTGTSSLTAIFEVLFVPAPLVISITFLPKNL